MFERPPTGGPLVSIRLADVPISLRRRHGAPLLARASEDGDILRAIDLKRAIESPSDRRYLVPREAVERVLGRAP